MNPENTSPKQHDTVPVSPLGLEVLECWAETVWNEVGKKEVRVFLTNGIKLDGVLAHADATGVTLVRDGSECKVMWHAIATYALKHLI